MRKFADISLPVDNVVVDAQPIVRICVTAVSLRDWCLCLQVLHDGLVEAFTFQRTASSQRVQIAPGGRNHFGISDSAGVLKVTLSAHDLDVTRDFFLRYYRDGAAEVDHIDIVTEEGGYIIFAVEESVPPVSAEEAKRRLGM